MWKGVCNETYVCLFAGDEGHPRAVQGAAVLHRGVSGAGGYGWPDGVPRQRRWHTDPHPHVLQARTDRGEVLGMNNTNYLSKS